MKEQQENKTVSVGKEVMLETDRLWLRPPLTEDLVAMAGIWGDAEVMRFLPTEKPMPPAESGKLFDSFLSHWRNHRFGPWAACLRGEPKLVGYCGLRMIQGRREMEFLYGFHPSCWGRGIGFEAAEASLTHGFRTLSNDWVIAAAMPGNRASVRILEKLGMKSDETVRHYGEGAAHYSILRAEFRSETSNYRVIPA